jgi:hypothetical protein
MRHEGNGWKLFDKDPIDRKTPISSQEYEERLELECQWCSIAGLLSAPLYHTL